MKEKQLDLAYRWKQIDIITKWIIINERDWQVRKQIHSHYSKIKTSFLSREFN